METEDAKKLDTAALEERRKQAVRLYQRCKCKNCTETGETVGAHRNTEGQWIKRWQESGLRALKVKECGLPLGFGRRFLPHEEAKIQKYLIDHCPDQLKLPFALWTRQVVRLHIKVSFGGWKYRFAPQGSIGSAGDLHHKSQSRKPINVTEPCSKMASRRVYPDKTLARSEDADIRNPQ